MKVECETDTSNLTPPSKIKKSYNNGIAEQKLKKNGIDDDVVPKLSYKFKDKNIKLTLDRLSATGYKGWSSVFCTHCACSGKWYYEVKINQDYKNLKFVGHDNSFKHHIKGHVRVGYACRYQRYDTPVGINSYGFSISDIDGQAYYNSKKFPYAISFSNFLDYLNL
ncbi:uncharacterized protein TA04475 [Theileria annulata]|uniref:B30.2/SPRY domain-containing protein n=1 Tax=Theileria annulata TaxID=5874 RepID=Q4UC17_THEAN|nr:uncharacterized protein TA04475 [Theileria annulata]CAI75634.1 hypothetical protein, conserved [Theileria annulata]|eukprot:XP_955110.1 hypothetical protein, conserved [Theileria annulata]